MIQENPPPITSALTAGRPAVGSMSVFRQARPTLLTQTTLIAVMDELGYSLLDTEELTVLDDKKLIGLVFTQAANEARR